MAVYQLKYPNNRHVVSFHDYTKEIVNSRDIIYENVLLGDYL